MWLLHLIEVGMVKMVYIIIKKYSIYLDYTYVYKSIWLLFIVGFVGIVYFISCYLLGLLKLKNYRTN